MTRRFQLVLASRSPRRIALLRGLGADPVVRPSSVKEESADTDPARDVVLRLAAAKARAVAQSLGAPDPPALVLAADTVVVIDGQVLGKPADAADAGSMLRRLRGRWHEVLTGVFVLRTDDERSAAGVESTRVRFRDYPDDLLAAYVACGEPLDKAGAYAIQDRGALLVDRIEGSWSNVVGLPIERLADWTELIGIRFQDLLDWSG